MVDLASGGIEVAASSHSPCYAAWHGRQGAAPGDCLAMPGQLRPNPLNLGNTALYADAMPGSLSKLMEGLTLLEAGTAAADLAPELLRSDTEAVIDRLLCRSRHFDLHCANAHLAHLAQRAAALGPAQIDLLAPFASPSPSPGHSAHPVFGSRLLVEPDFPGLAWEPLDNAAAVRACHQAGAKARWRGCQGKVLVDTISELYGQGHARTTPAGVAAQWLSLARLANRHQHPGQVSTAPAMPHMARPAVPTRATTSAPDSGASPAAAATLLDILASGHVSGTSHSACRAARAYASAPGLALNCKALEPGLRIAQKTGTPVWSADKLTQAQWLKGCTAVAPKPVPGQGQRAAQTRNAALTACRLSPIKWWAAAVGDERGWHKVVVVLAERNWRRSGRIDAAGDIGPNVAAEAGLAFIQGQAPAWRAATLH